MLVLAASALLVALGMGVALGVPAIALVLEAEVRAKNCLLYTSDAADE